VASVHQPTMSHRLVFTGAPPGCLHMDFLTLSVDDVITVVRDKQCASNPLPTSLLRENIDVLAPFLVELFNRSLIHSIPCRSTVFKSAYITRLKKPDLDPAENKSYRPISNLSVLSKSLERLVACQLLDYLYAADLTPDLHSAYRSHHLTEAAVLKVLSDILRAVDSGDHCCSTAARPIHCLRHGGPCNTSAPSEEVVRSGWSRVRLVPVLPQWSIPVCSLWRNIIDLDQAGLRCSTAIGSWAASVSSLHRRAASTGSCTAATSIRRRHSDLRLLSMRTHVSRTVSV